ncbi:acyl-CoA thioesterase [Kitasatospora sp. NPDC056138]|uniref:acyl-CoA thioesterase n=1 Tax=Kitasatospora sp. NPDC056138 TaxID=3345724 RepID=UPI0035D69077
MFFGESRLILPVRPNDLDALGHVNNAVALEYLETGRWDWLGSQGIEPGDRMIAVVARTEIDYLAEIPRGRVEVRTVLESPTAEEFDEDGLTYRARFRQRVHLPETDRLAVDALVTVAFLDAEQRCLVPMQDFLAAAVRG